mgnify:CR=1 FL=1|tara:strand:+ start:16994 stop:17716 length:723 start_codon:yes stop_codon:yes gene_type:complete
MATKLTDLAALGGTPALNDLFTVVDVSDTSGGAAGTSKKVTYANLGIGGGGSSGGNIISGGARMNISTAQDAGAKCMIWGGSLGFCYYIWSSNAGDNPLTTGGDLGTPGSTQMTVDLDSITNGLFRVPNAGTASLFVNQEFDSSAEVAGVVMRYFMYKCDSATVTALENGTGDTGSLTATLVASAKVTVPASSQNIKPMVVTSSNGVSVSAGDLVFGCTVYDGTVTTTQYFPTNIQMFTT